MGQGWCCRRKGERPGRGVGAEWAARCPQVGTKQAALRARLVPTAASCLHPLPARLPQSCTSEAANVCRFVSPCDLLVIAYLSPPQCFCFQQQNGSAVTFFFPS